MEKRNPSAMYPLCERVRVWKEWGQICYYCDEKLPRPGTKAGRATHFDHLIPPALGGTDSLDNLRPACKRCNTRKGESQVMDFIDRRLRQMQRASARLKQLRKDLT